MKEGLNRSPSQFGRVFGWVIIAAALHSSETRAQLAVVADKEPQRIFGGDGRKIAVVWRNDGAKTVDIPIRARIFQTSSATAVALSDKLWKRLEILAGQTVIESATFDFPAVKADTRFLIQWLEGTNRIVGRTEVLVYPPDLLKHLKPLIEEEPLGAFDPQNHLKPRLKAAGVEFSDLEDTGFEDFRGKLAIIGPFDSKVQMAEALASQIRKLAAKGVAVVWLLPPPERREPIKPSFYTVTEGNGAVVIVQPSLVLNLSESPQAQLNLIQFGRLALHPEPGRFPN